MAFCEMLILLDYPYKTFVYITTVCTVDLLIPKRLAAERTVARLSMMNTARSQARCSIFVYICTTPHAFVFDVYVKAWGDMRGCGRMEAQGGRAEIAKIYTIAPGL